MKNGEIPDYAGYDWPGLRDLLTANDSFQNFTVKNKYTPGQFTDVTNQWYSDSVKKVYEIGLMKGNSAGNFNPEGTIISGRSLRWRHACTIFVTRNGEFTQGAVVQCLWNMQLKTELLKDDFSDYSLAATRGEMALHICFCSS